MKRSAKVVATAVLVGLVGFVSLSQAVPVGPLFNTTGGTTLLSDNSADFVIQRDGNTTLNVNDILVTIIGINTVNKGGGDVPIGTGSAVSEITAITAVKIASGPSSVQTNAQGIQIGTFNAAPLTAADAAAFNWAGTIPGAGGLTFASAFGATNNGQLIGLAFEDPANDYTRTGSIAAGLTSASNGSPVFAVSLNSPGDFVQISGPVDTVAFGILPPNTQVALASVNFDGTISAQNPFIPGFILAPQITGGNGGLSSPGGGGFPVWDNQDFTVTAQPVPTIPEPSTVMLFGFGLVGLGILVHRRKKQA